MCAHFGITRFTKLNRPELFKMSCKKETEKELEDGRTKKIEKE